MVAKIAVVGTHGVGKTTLVQAFMQKLAVENISGELAPEMPRVICDLVKDKSFFRQGNNTVLKQILLIYSQAQIEFQKSQSSSDIIICDRSILDHWAYTKYFFAEILKRDGVLNLYEHFISEFCRTYRKLFYIPIEFPLTDDGIREDDKGFQKAIDEIIFDLLESYALPYSVVRGSVEERCQNIFENVQFSMGFHKLLRDESGNSK
jgi:GTPase SAR1 family protein